MRDACQKDHGIKCFADMSEVDGYYGLIVLSHVLEHTLQPMPLLSDIYDRLSGQLLLQVPLLMPGIPHPLVFTESSAVWMVNRAGYDVLKASAFERYFTVWAGKPESGAT
jgi:hypothetical protein